ncbi:hypothetical protein HU200_055590 [Digitaria exilis]|uniref:Late embryogenesis abundant protein LEA-2 subgroup domain-containing protein n=1 Tax=Digitaria exilis TaxID=1010633 RepID=A0A835E4D9_9POAL|nr:hypothetical protein HU200_055590 [Digitaria exilis]
MGDDIGGCHGVCCLCCICGAKAICNLYAFIAAVVLTAVLVAAFAFPIPVHATVTDASLSRLDLIGGGSVHNHNNNNNGGGGHHYSLAYNLSLAIVLRNPNWRMRAELTSPLDAEIRFAGRRFDGARLAGAGRRIRPDTTEEFAVVAVSSLRGVALGGDAAWEFVKESSAGVFELELKLDEKVSYRPFNLGRSRRVELTCPVKMLMVPAPASAARMTHLMVFDKVVACA